MCTTKTFQNLRIRKIPEYTKWCSSISNLYKIQNISNEKHHYDLTKKEWNKKNVQLADELYIS